MFSFGELLTSLAPYFTVAVIILGPQLMELIPAAVSDFLFYLYRKYVFKPQLTLIIEMKCDMDSNEIYKAATAYLRTKISDSSKFLKVSKSIRQEKPAIDLVAGEVIIDNFEGIKLKWKIKERNDKPYSSKKVLYLAFDKRFKNNVLESYLPHVLKCYKEIREAERVARLYRRCDGEWDSIILKHPATFEKLAMDPELKTMVIDDLNRFVMRKELYMKVGKPWKRGYLFYGPPGTGKSSLIAAIANHLKFDIYDLKFSEIRSDSDLRSILTSTSNRSIIAIEDIDCGTVSDKQVQRAKVVNQISGPRVKFTLSGLLSFIDGLWSSCGDERIIVFTTNHKEKLDALDPALFCRGRVDMEVPMTFCTMDGFKLLASNYLSINDHDLFGKIEGLLENKKVTPAEIGEELLKSDDTNVVLEGLVKFLEEKETQKKET